MRSRRTGSATLAFVIALAGCSSEPRSQAAESSAAPKIDLAPRLASIGALTEAPEPTPELAPDVTVSASNTLVITEAELADLRGKNEKKPPPTPKALAFVALVRERGTYELDVGSKLARTTVSIWDLDARRWVGSLWVTVELTPQISREMVQTRNGKEHGPSFTERETPEQIATRHAKTLRDAIALALTKRQQVWNQQGMNWPFDPSRAKTYPIAPPADRPARGAADAKAVVQMFVQHGDRDVALRVARIAQVYGDRVRVVARNRTLDFEPGSELAAQAALEVFAQAGAPGFWRYLDALAALPRRASRAPTLDLATLVEAATALGGVDAAKLRTAIETHAHAAAIKADMAALRAAGLQGRTSTWLVNDWLITSGDWTAIDGALQAALAR